MPDDDRGTPRSPRSTRPALPALAALLFATLLCAPLLCAPLLSAALGDGAGTWLRVDAEGERLQVVAVPVVLEFAGSGSLSFSDDHREIAFAGPPSITIGGGSAGAGAAARGSNIVEVRHAGSGSTWTIRRVDAASLRGEGTRIRDDAPQDGARVDSRAPTRFFLQLEPDGGSQFFYPGDDHPEDDG